MIGNIIIGICFSFLFFYLLAVVFANLSCLWRKGEKWQWTGLQ
jgi:hypothetical protein